MQVMIREATAVPRAAFDRFMVERVLVSSSSAPAREAAAAWVAAYDTALACGAREDEALGRANDAWRIALRRNNLAAAA